MDDKPKWFPVIKAPKLDPVSGEEYRALADLYTDLEGCIDPDHRECLSRSLVWDLIKEAKKRAVEGQSPTLLEQLETILEEADKW